MEEKVSALAKELSDAGHDFFIVIAKDGKVIGRSHSYSNKKNVEAIIQEFGSEITKMFDFIFPF